MEPVVPSFRNFVMKTPSPSQQKPLPPVPPIHRRSVSTSTLNSIAHPIPTETTERRTSSVYSRTPSQWASGCVSLRSSIVEDSDLHPSDDSRGSPCLTDSHYSPKILLPRTYGSATSCSTSQSSSQLLWGSPALSSPSPPGSWGMETPCGSAMLPEDLALGYSEALRHISREEASAATILVGTEPPKAMASLATQCREESRTKAAQALGLADLDEPRGRTRHRGPRQLNYSHYFPKAVPDGTGGKENGSSKENAQEVAAAYHAALTDQYRRPSAEADEFVRLHMKMVPSPLFSAKPRPRQVPSGSLSSHALSAKMDRSSGETFEGARDFVSVSAAEQCKPSTLSGHSRQSSSGSIPISPPQSYSTNAAWSAQKSKKQRRYDHFDQERLHRTSAYYPHVMRRKQRQASSMKNSGSIVSPNACDRFDRYVLITGTRASPTNEHSSSKSIGTRIANGAAHYIEAVTRSSQVRQVSFNLTAASSKRQDTTSTDVCKVSSEGQELAANADGGSSSARFIRFPPENEYYPPRVVHTVLPARPLNMRRNGQCQSEDAEAHAGRMGVLGSLMEMRKEAKAEKRRQELKKLIRIVQASGEDEPTVV